MNKNKKMATALLCTAFVSSLIFTGCGGGNTASIDNIDTEQNHPVYTLSRNNDAMLFGSAKGLESVGKNQRATGFHTLAFTPKKQKLRSGELGRTDIYAITKQEDGKLLVGGNFGYINGEIRNSIARINKDGSLDKKFLNAVSGINGEVYDIKIASNGDIVISGYFTNFNNSKSDAVAILKNDGTKFTAVNALHDTYKLSVINDIEFLDNLLILSGLFVDNLENEIGLIILNIDDLSINKKMTDIFKIDGQVFNTYLDNSSIYVVGNFKHDISDNIMIFDKNGNPHERIFEFKDIDGFIFDIEIVDNLIYLTGDFTAGMKKNLLVINEKNEVLNTIYEGESTIFDINVDTKYLYLATDAGLQKLKK